MNLMEIVERIGVTDEQKTKYCTARDLDGGHCLATTNENCNKCKLYQFNLIGQGQIIAESYEKLEEENKTLNECFDSMSDAVGVVASAVESLYTLARPTRDKADRGNAKNLELCKQIIAEARKIKKAGGNARFISFPGENKSRMDAAEVEE